MKIYVAGPMRNVPKSNHPAFFAVTALLRALGHDVFNPAEEENRRHGRDMSEEPPQDLAHYMVHDLAAVCARDCVVALPGWEDSDGAVIEEFVATKLGKPWLQLPALPADPKHAAAEDAAFARFLAEKDQAGRCTKADADVATVAPLLLDHHLPAELLKAGKQSTDPTLVATPFGPLIDAGSPPRGEQTVLLHWPDEPPARGWHEAADNRWWRAKERGNPDSTWIHCEVPPASYSGFTLGPAQSESKGIPTSEMED